ncbi:hypothetical protein Nepgr_013145 [Nepenthes gracilis]|uniref:ASCH domain-containing protein n=1 Tax=Nepenthes gracilis TaxID=150966 RepID=A0AAD3SIG8_NEPGR|nr:hypothetical protein Nepgr_013145 [Nepenthes gracilis]
MAARNKLGNCKNPCLTMHQPWASLLVHGIKRIEGRSWPAPLRGLLWIHAASKVPDATTIKAMEDFYREIYALSGITDVKFPEEYPVSRLVGCVEVVGCVRCEELTCWQAVPEGVRLEGLTDFCWLCEHPQKLLVPLEMRGYKGIYNLERKISEDAFRRLVRVQSLVPIKFPLPNPRDPYSLRPGSLSLNVSDTRAPDINKSSSLVQAIVGARAAATQFSRKDQNSHGHILQKKDSINSILTEKWKSVSLEEEIKPVTVLRTESQRGSSALHSRQGSINFEYRGNNSGHHQVANYRPIGPSKIFAAAVKGLEPV